MIDTVESSGSERRSDRTKRYTIGIDARLVDAQVTGVERMLRGFLSHCVTSPTRSEADLVLFVDREPDPSVTFLSEFRVVVVPSKRGLLQSCFDFWLAFDLVPFLRREGVDLLYTPHTKLPFGDFPTVVTIHGLEWLLYPAGYRWLQRIKQRFWLKVSLARAAGIVTFAHNTRNDLRRYSGRFEPPLRVVPEGVDPMFTPESRGCSVDVRKRLAIPDTYILSVCSLEPRKNIERLIRSFAVLVEQDSLPHALVLVGKAAWRSHRLAAVCSELGVSDRVVFTGYISDSELNLLYNDAALFVYPSLYEGFGLPVVEAMKCNVPVVTSGSSSLVEVAGGAAVLADPYSVDDLASAIARSLSDGELRARMIEHGAENAARYQWQKTADEIIEFLLERVKGLSRPGD